MRRLILSIALMAQVAAAQSTSNILVNGGFEDLVAADDGMKASDWKTYASGKSSPAVVTNAVREGKRCIHMAVQGEPKGAQGILQEVPVEEKEKYTLTVRVLNDREEPLGGPAYLQLVIEWKDPIGKEVGRHFGGERDARLSKSRWDEAELAKVKAPRDATSAVIGIHLFDGDGTSRGALLVDEVVFVKE